MDNLLGLWCKKKELKQLNACAKRFWETYEKKRDRNFAQQGYEDKGYGHIERIIGNVEELLGNYCDLLYQLNYPEDKAGDNTAPSRKEFEDEFLKILRPTLIMFFLAALLHDIGMTIPGIFEALKDVLTVSDDSAQHLSAIVHNYHNYGSFILLLELNHIEIVGKNNTKEYAFLDYIPEKNKNQHIKNLVAFKKFLSGIYKEHFSEAEKNHFEEEEFFVILAIICLVHKEVDIEDVRSILRRFQPGYDKTVKHFNKWWDFFNRAREWTLAAPKWLPQYLKTENKKEKEIFPELIPLKKFPEAHLDILLASALLQYGDKTEITIARLTKDLKKKKSGKDENINTPQTNLEKFWFDTQWDNQEGYICTEMAQQVISDFSRFRACRFIPLFLVKTRNHPGTDPPRLDVVMHYFRFPTDKDVFTLIRYHDEKDFSDLKFLDVIKVHIPLLIHNFKNKNLKIEKNILVDINLRRKEYPFPTVDDELKKLVHYFFTTREGMAALQRDIDEIPLKNSFEKFMEESKLEEQVGNFIKKEEGFIKLLVQKGKCENDQEPDEKLKKEISSKPAPNGYEQKPKGSVADGFIEHPFSIISDETLKKRVEKLMESTIGKEFFHFMIGTSGKTSIPSSPKTIVNFLKTKNGKGIVLEILFEESDKEKCKELIDANKGFREQFTGLLDTMMIIEITRKAIEYEAKVKKFYEPGNKLNKFFMPFIAANKFINEIEKQKSIKKYSLPDERVNELRNRILVFIKNLVKEGIVQKDINQPTIDEFSRLSLNYEEKIKLLEFLGNLEEKIILKKILDKAVDHSFFSETGKKKYKEILEKYKKDLENPDEVHQFIIDILKKCGENKRNKEIADYLNALYKKNLRENRLYAQDEKLACLLYDPSDEREKLVKVLASLQYKIESSSDRIAIEERFPYTPQNRKVIAEFSKSIRKPGFKNKELFHETSDLIIPSSFELLAILNLYRQEE